jgi:hypothetical protein
MTHDNSPQRDASPEVNDLRTTKAYDLIEDALEILNGYDDAALSLETSEELKLLASRMERELRGKQSRRAMQERARADILSRRSQLRSAADDLMEAQISDPSSFLAKAGALHAAAQLVRDVPPALPARSSDDVDLPEWVTPFQPDVFALNGLNAERSSRT